MRLTFLLIAAMTAASAAAQQTPPDPVPAGNGQQAPASGLADLNGTVNDLQDRETAPPSRDEAAPAAQPADQPRAADPGAADATPAAEPAAPAPDRAESPVPQPPEAHPPVLPPYLRHPGAALDPEQTRQIARTVARGQAMIAIARAGVVGSQDMLAHVPDPDGAGIAGWLAEPQGNGMLVTFYAVSQSGPKAVYRVNVLGTRAVSREAFLDPNERPALTPIQARLAAARGATDALSNHPCSGQDFNVLVIPPDTPDGPIDVYQMSPAVPRGHFPVGGHFRSRVAASGEIEEVQSYGPCVDLVPPATPVGTVPTPLPVAGPDDQLPNEIHVFLATWTGHPLLVTSGGRTWRVTSDSIAEPQ